MPLTCPWPQTLLLTALALLIAAATIMLACGQGAPPAPAEGIDALPVARPADGGTAAPPEPAAELTTTPVSPRPAVADLPAREIDARNAAPTPEVIAAAATPTAEPEPPTATPTPEPAAPTDTPPPEVPAKAAAPAPATPEKSAPQETENTESPEPTVTPTPTPRPTICFREGDGFVCIDEPPPAPTPKYPILRQFSIYAQEAEEAQAKAGQAGGASGPSEVKVRKVFVRINLSSGASGEPMLAWLQSNGVPLTTDWPYGVSNHLAAVYGTGFAAGAPDGYIQAIVPATLLVSLTQQPGFASIEDACLTFPCYPDYYSKNPD